MVITAEEAQKIHESSLHSGSPEQMATDVMTERTEKTVRACCSQGMRTAYISIPSFLIGVPVYDRNVVCDKVMSIFRENSFIVKREEPDSFSLTWGKASAAEEIEPVKEEDIPIESLNIEEKEEEVVVEEEEEETRQVVTVVSAMPVKTQSVRLVK